VPDPAHSITAAAPPDALYPLVARGPGFQAWWAEEVVVRPNGATELGFFNRATAWREPMFRLKAAAEGKTPRARFRTSSLAY
jgi:hypothetical protein